MDKKKSNKVAEDGGLALERAGVKALESELIFLLTALREIQTEYRFEVTEISIRNIGGASIVLKSG